MAMVRKWTGRESHALREAMRLSQRDFADQLGVTGRTIWKWEAGGAEIVPRPDSQAILDTKLRQVSDEVRVRFESIIDGDKAKIEKPVEGGNDKQSSRGTAPGGKRACGKCGLPLSRYNSGNLCQACLSAGWKKDSTGRADVNAFHESVDIPAEFWGRPETVKALHAGSVGRILALILDSVNVSQGVLGSACGLDQGKISSIVSGARNPKNIAVLDRIATGLNMPDDARVVFGLAPKLPSSVAGNNNYSELNSHALVSPGNTIITLSKPADASGSESQVIPDSLRTSFAADTVEDVKRREFLMGAATAAGFSAVGAITARETIRLELGSSVIGHSGVTDVEEWREIGAEYGESYPVTEPGELLKSLMVDLYGLKAAMQAVPGESQQRALRAVGAMLSAFTAQTIANLGNLSEARRWWRTARNGADESGDPFTVLWIRGREIVRAGYEQRPVSAILQLIDELEARVTGSSPITAMPGFLAGKAQTLALMGEPAAHEAENTLSRLRDSFDALPIPTRTATDSIFSWGEERLRFTESLTYTYLGNYRSAEKAQTAALALYPADDLRSPAQIELQRSLCIIGAGDPLSGVRHAQKVISGLPAMHRIRPVADLGHKVLRAIPARERSHSAAQEYGECLYSAFTVAPELTA